MGTHCFCRSMRASFAPRAVHSYRHTTPRIHTRTQSIRHSFTHAIPRTFTHCSARASNSACARTASMVCCSCRFVSGFMSGSEENGSSCAGLGSRTCVCVNGRRSLHAYVCMLHECMGNPLPVPCFLRRALFHGTCCVFSCVGHHPQGRAQHVRVDLECHVCCPMQTLSLKERTCPD